MTLQVAGILQGSAELTGMALDSDCIIEPVRGPLIPGFAAVKRAAKAAGVQCWNLRRPLPQTLYCNYIQVAFRCETPCCFLSDASTVP